MAVRGSGVMAYSALALVASGALTGCTDDGVSLHVICPIVPEIEDNQCTYAADSDTCVLEGVMNLQATTTYGQVLRVESGLKPRARDVPPQSETNGIQVQGAEVELRTPDGRRIDFSGLSNPFSVTATGFVAPGGFAVVGLDLIQPPYWAQLKSGAAETTTPLLAKVVAAIQLWGNTNGSVSVEAGEYLWPIRLISVNPFSSGGDCVTGIEVCGGSFGQDGFAVACYPD
jgi:hypothetical protein